MTYRRFIPVVLCSAFLASVASSTQAHHGTAVSYDQGRWITVTGTVTEFRWRNPHSILFLAMKDDSGNDVSYTIELPSPVLMSRSLGWTRATFTPGDTVEFRVHPSRTDAPVGECLNDCIVKVNGEFVATGVQRSGN